MRRLSLILAVWLVLTGCTVLYMTPGGGVLVVGNPGVNIPGISATPSPVGTIDPTPTIVHEPSPTVTPTFHFTDEDNYTVYTLTRLNLRNGVNGTIIRVLATGTPLEVQIGVSVELPSPWLYVIDTSDGQPGFVSGEYVDVRPPGE